MKAKLILYEVMKLLLILNITACYISAQEAEEKRDPYVWNMMFSEFDITSLKAGEWAEYNETLNGKDYRTKLTCVKIEIDSVWIESIHKELIDSHPGTVLLLIINKLTRQISKAYWGKPGDAGKMIYVSPPGKPCGTYLLGTHVFETGTVSRDTTMVGKSEFACEKIQIDSSATEKTTSGPYTHQWKTTQWLSDKAPFRRILNDHTPTLSNGEFKWKTDKPVVLGGLVKEEYESEGRVIPSKTLVAWGLDGKQMLSVLDDNNIKR